MQIQQKVCFVIFSKNFIWFNFYFDFLGAIIIKNWKPLPLDIVSDSPLVSVGEILGELTSVVTLRIAILRSKPSTLTEIKDKLLKLLVFQSHAILRSTGCPLDEVSCFFYFYLVK